MYPRSRKPGAATSNSGGSKRKNVFTTGTRYERKPRSLGMLLRMRTTAGPNPKPPRDDVRGAPGGATSRSWIDDQMSVQHDDRERYKSPARGGRAYLQGVYR